MFEIRGAARRYMANRPARGNSAAKTDRAGRGRVPAARCCHCHLLGRALLPDLRPTDSVSAAATAL